MAAVIVVFKKEWVNSIEELKDICWGQAIKILKEIDEAGLEDELLSFLSEISEDGTWDETQLNDLLTYDWKTVYEAIGMNEEEEDFAKKKLCAKRKSCSNEKNEINTDEYFEKLPLDYFNTNLTREEAIKLVGKDKVEEVEAENCEYRSQSDIYKEEYWTASVELGNSGYYHLDIVYAVPEKEFFDEDGEPIQDLGSIDWGGYIDHYKLG
jgi:hypothetical protein